MNLDEAEYRYRHDAPFAQVVNMIEHLIYGMHLTPSQMRDAAIYAACRMELRRCQEGTYMTREQFENLWPEKAEDRKINFDLYYNDIPLEKLL